MVEYDCTAATDQRSLRDSPCRPDVHLSDARGELTPSREVEIADLAVGQ